MKKIIIFISTIMFIFMTIFCVYTSASYFKYKKNYDMVVEWHIGGIVNSAKKIDVNRIQDSRDAIIHLVTVLHSFEMLYSITMTNKKVPINNLYPDLFEYESVLKDIRDRMLDDALTKDDLLLLSTIKKDFIQFEQLIQPSLNLNKYKKVRLNLEFVDAIRIY